MFVSFQDSQGRTVRLILMNACQILANMEATVRMASITTPVSVTAQGELLELCSKMYILHYYRTLTD
jgi:hypothetical protein